MSGTSGDGVDASLINSDGIEAYESIKDKYYEYKYYHSSKDNLNFISSKNILKSINLYYKLIIEIEKIKFLKNRKPNGEVMLSKYNLYPKIGSSP